LSYLAASADSVALARTKSCKVTAQSHDLFNISVSSVKSVSFVAVLTRSKISLSISWHAHCMRVNTAGHAHSRFTQSCVLTFQVRERSMSKDQSADMYRVHLRPLHAGQHPQATLTHAGTEASHATRVGDSRLQRTPIPSHFPTHIDRYAPRSAYLSPHTHFNSRNAPSWPSQGLIRQRRCTWDQSYAQMGGISPRSNIHALTFVHVHIKLLSRQDLR
jgi:hypothetical protein